jgi:uncharacterized protein YcbX
MAVEITALHTYPVKSCRGSSHAASVLHATGFAWDRHWMFVTESGRFITQRECAALARVEPVVEGHTLVLRSAGHPELRCPVETLAAPLRVRIWNDECLARPVSVDTRDWLQAVTGTRAQLVRLPPGAERISNPRFTGNDGSRYYLADAFALLITNEASLTELNTRLPKTVPMARFRPNIVVRGLAPYAEDDIDRLVIGAVELRCVKPCIRCITITTDQVSGERAGDEPLRTLGGFRRIPALNGAAFGMNAVIARGAGATLSVGDRADVVWRAPGAPRPW